MIGSAKQASTTATAPERPVRTRQSCGICGAGTGCWSRRTRSSVVLPPRPDRRGSALLRRHQGCVLRPDRRLIHQRPDGRSSRSERHGQRGIPTLGPGRLQRSVEFARFRSRTFVHALNRHQFIGWTGRVGAAGADAAMESFFAMLQKKVRDRARWRTREDLRIAIITRVERSPTPPAGPPGPIAPHRPRGLHEPGRPRGLTTHLSYPRGIPFLRPLRGDSNVMTSCTEHHPAPWQRPSDETRPCAALSSGVAPSDPAPPGVSPEGAGVLDHCPHLPVITEEIDDRSRRHQYHPAPRESSFRFFADRPAGSSALRSRQALTDFCAYSWTFRDRRSTNERLLTGINIDQDGGAVEKSTQRHAPVGF